MQKFRATIVAALAALAMAGPAGAQDLDTLKKIKATGIITMGVRDAAVPFSYNDHMRLPVGYSIDLCMRVIDSIKISQDLPKLDVKMRLVNPAIRIPLVANGTVDIECGSTTNTIERQQQVAFLPTTFVAATRFAFKKTSNIKSMDDLKGKTVTAATGTTNLRQITEINTQRGLRMTIVPAKTTADGFAMLEKGDVLAFASDDILLYGMISNAGKPADFAVTDEPLSVEPYGIMIRKDDPVFKQVAGDAIRVLFKSGEIENIYAKWFIAPIAPKNTPLNAPMSAALKRAIATPIDSGNPTDY